MDESHEKTARVPSPRQVHRSVELYLAIAYPGGPPEPISHLLPDDPLEVVSWLMSDATQRDPADAPLEGVRSFALRLGNAGYPHMKLRWSRPPGERLLVLSVDSHDAFLNVPAGSGDDEALESLKRENSRIAAAIHAAWDAAGLPTERNYLRRKIRDAKDRRRG